MGTELREELFKSLRASGTVDLLKASLRAKVIDGLRERKLGIMKRPDDPDEEDRALARRIANSIVVEHLEMEGCMYTLSVFVPEGGMEVAEPLGRSQISKLIGIGEAGLVGKENRGDLENLSEKPKSILLDLIESASQTLESKHNRKVHTVLKDSGSQTSDDNRMHDGDTASDLLDRKLSRVSDRFSMLVEREALVPRQSIEERMIKYQRDTDKRAESHIQNEIARFQESELANMRIQERAMYRRELTIEKERLQREYRSKWNDLSKRELSLADHIKRKESEVESLLYEERQTLLQKLKNITSQTEKDRQKLELELTALDKERRFLERRQIEIEKDQMKLGRLENDLRMKYEDLTRTFRQKTLADFHEREQSIQVEKARLDEATRSLQATKDTHAAKLVAADGLSSRIQSLEQNLTSLRGEREELLVKVQTFDNQVNFIKEAAQHDRERYDALYSQYVQVCKDLEQARKNEEASSSMERFKEQERTIASLSRKLLDAQGEFERQLKALQNEIAEMEMDACKERRENEERLSKASVLFRQQTADIRDKLAWTEQELEVITIKFEEAKASARTFQEENGELRRLLAQARKAIQKDLSEPKESRPASPPQQTAPYNYSFRGPSVMPFWEMFPQAAHPSQMPFYFSGASHAQGFYPSNHAANVARESNTVHHSYPPPPSNSSSTNAATSNFVDIEQSGSKSPSRPSSPKSGRRSPKILNVSPPSSPMKQNPKQLLPSPPTSPRTAQSPRSLSSPNLPSPIASPLSIRNAGRERSTSTQNEQINNAFDSPDSCQWDSGAIPPPRSPALISTEVKRPAESENDDENNSTISEVEEATRDQATPSPKEIITHDLDVLQQTTSIEEARPNTPQPHSDQNDDGGIGGFGVGLIGRESENDARVVGQKQAEKVELVQEKTDMDMETEQVVKSRESAAEIALEALREQREAVEKKKKLQMQQAKDRAKRAREAEQKMKEENERRERERQQEEARLAKEAEEEAKQLAEAEERKEREAEEAKKKENDHIIQQYREKALAKLAEARGQTNFNESEEQSPKSPSGSEISGGGSYISPNDSPSSAKSRKSAFSAIASSVSAAKSKSDEEEESDDWTF